MYISQAKPGVTFFCLKHAWSLQLNVGCSCCISIPCSLTNNRTDMITYISFKKHSLIFQLSFHLPLSTSAPFLLISQAEGLNG